MHFGAHRQTERRQSQEGRNAGRLEIEQLRENQFQTVMAACPESGDVLGNDAAARIAKVISGANITAAEAFTGRVNLFAEKNGVFVAEAERIMDLNRVHEAMTVATLSPRSRVTAGQMVATVKIIPFAVSDDRLLALEAGARTDGPDLSVSPFRARPVALILSCLPEDTAKVIKKRHHSIGERLGSLGGELIDVRQCDHNLHAVSHAMREAQAKGVDLILVFGSRGYWFSSLSLFGVVFAKTAVVVELLKECRSLSVCFALFVLLAPASTANSIEPAQSVMPVAMITHPSDGEMFFADQTINLRGYGFDWGEGIVNSGLAWTSDVDDAIGSGNNMPICRNPSQFQSAVDSGARLSPSYRANRS